MYRAHNLLIYTANCFCILQDLTAARLEEFRAKQQELQGATQDRYTSYTLLLALLLLTLLRILLL
jgi:hypothetical protein